jgi:hypothetical protein
MSNGSGPRHILPNDVIWRSNTQVEIKIVIPSPGPGTAYTLQVYAYFATTLASAKAGITSAATRGAAIHDAPFLATVTLTPDSGDVLKTFVGVMYRVTETLTGHVHERMYLISEKPAGSLPQTGTVRWCGGFEGKIVRNTTSATKYLVWCPDGVTTGASAVNTPGGYLPPTETRLWGATPEVVTVSDTWFAVMDKLPATPIKANSFLFNTGAGTDPRYYLIVADSPSDPNRKKYLIDSISVSDFCGFSNGTWYSYGTGNGPDGSTITTAQFTAIPSGSNIPYHETWAGFN